MIAKELREAWWKFGVGIALFAIALPNLIPYEVILKDVSNPPAAGPDGSPMPERFTVPIDPVEYALQEMWFMYGVNSGWVTMTLAAFLGFSLISGETSRGSIFLLLSSPISRTRLLLTKYGVGAGVLLAFLAFGALGLIVSAGLKGYPLGALDVPGLGLSVALLWLGSLSALGLAVLVSVVFRDVIASAVATPIAFALIFFLPGALASYVVQIQEGFRTPETSALVFDRMTLPLYWANESLFTGEGLAATEFIVCAVAATLPLLAAIWFFNRKAY